jgi:hypothetical protein
VWKEKVPFTVKSVRRNFLSEIDTAEKIAWGDHLNPLASRDLNFVVDCDPDAPTTQKRGGGEDYKGSDLVLVRHRPRYPHGALQCLQESEGEGEKVPHEHSYVREVGATGETD